MNLQTVDCAGGSFHRGDHCPLDAEGMTGMTGNVTTAGTSSP
jgi:hypothetical protein